MRSPSDRFEPAGQKETLTEWITEQGRAPARQNKSRHEVTNKGPAASTRDKKKPPDRRTPYPRGAIEKKEKGMGQSPRKSRGG
jgi:hypothetical protein